MRKALIEHPGLHGERYLRRKNLALETAQGAKRTGAQPEGDEKRHESAQKRDEADGDEQASEADSASVQSDDLAVGGKAPEANQDAYENCHGDREDQYRG